jgi:DNA-binding HxlR family transcriptional regulator
MSGYDVFLADCPARTTLALVSDTWSAVIIIGLARGGAYELTALGESLLGPLTELTRWAEENTDALLAAAGD